VVQTLAAPTIDRAILGTSFPEATCRSGFIFVSKQANVSNPIQHADDQRLSIGTWESLKAAKVLLSKAFLLPAVTDFRPGLTQVSK
jgi:hypothetical protein